MLFLRVTLDSKTHYDKNKFGAEIWYILHDSVGSTEVFSLELHTLNQSHYIEVSQLTSVKNKAELTESNGY